MAIDTVFEEIIKRIKPELVNSSFQNLNEDKALVITEKEFSTWEQIIKDKVLENFHFNNLNMIIVGSSGVRGFNGPLAMICTYKKPHYMSPTAKNLINSLFHAFKTDPNQQNNPNDPTKESNFYDYGCSKHRANVLFINVCLTTRNDDYKNAVCTIRFLNELLKETANIEKKVVVLDFRLTQHKHIDNISNRFPDEISISRNPIYRQNDRVFEIVHPINNDYYSFCHPKHLNASNDNFTKMYNDINNKGYPIKRMYLKSGSEWQ